jgi:hypothetical protein
VPERRAAYSVLVCAGIVMTATSGMASGQDVQQPAEPRSRLAQVRERVPSGSVVECRRRTAAS